MRRQVRLLTIALNVWRGLCLTGVDFVILLIALHTALTIFRIRGSAERNGYVYFSIDGVSLVMHTPQARKHLELSRLQMRPDLVFP